MVSSTGRGAAGGRAGFLSDVVMPVDWVISPASPAPEPEPGPEDHE